MIYMAQAIIRDDIEEAREMARPHCVRWLIMGAMARGLREAGIDLDRLEIPEELREGPSAGWMQTLKLYPDLHHAEDWETARRLCAFIPSDVLAQICDVLGLIGTPEYCAQWLQEAYANGIDHLYLASAETYSFPHSQSFGPLRKPFFPPSPLSASQRTLRFSF